ncbi:hypothetical protein GCM10010371_59920 [Streptomyces subrutilus]|uniref:Cytochrome P450 n=1 Tax=Streptomyces subrutilus TaxID=36818 RepID=A0A918R9U0_9ACTN|nr:hypothetical protein GCM10010371_59920 [Streptomyces subrutilus]
MIIQRFAHPWSIGLTTPGHRRDPRAEALLRKLEAHDLLLLDGPGHRRLRRAMAPAFVPAAVERLGPRITTMARDLVDARGSHRPHPVLPPNADRSVSDRGLAGLATNRAWWFPEPPGPLTHGRTPPGEVAPGDAGAGRVEVGGPGSGCVKWLVGVLSGRIRLR